MPHVEVSFMFIHFLLCRCRSVFVLKYAACRGLMERDEWRNLGMENLPPVSSQEASSSSASKSDVPSSKPHPSNKASS